MSPTEIKAKQYTDKFWYEQPDPVVTKIQMGYRAGYTQCEWDNSVIGVPTPKPTKEEFTVDGKLIQPHYDHAIRAWEKLNKLEAAKVKRPIFGYVFEERFYKTLDELSGFTMSENNKPTPVYNS